MNIPGNVNGWVLIVLILSALVLYLTPLQSKSFYFDDKFSIEHNELIKNVDVPKIFKAFNTRFLPGLSFALNYQVCALNPTGYRLVNLSIHCLNAFLVFLLIQSIFAVPLPWPAFFGSMLFLCHPIQTEAVNSVTQRFVLMGSFFYLSALLMYIRYRVRSQKKYLMASLLAGVAAMFCKEFVVTLPLTIVLCDIYFLGALAESRWKFCRRVLPFFIIVLIVPLLLLKTPKEAIGVANIASDSINTSRTGNHIDITRARKGMGRGQYFLTEVNVLCTYVRLLFVPVNQDFDYDYPLANGLDSKTLLCGVFLFCLLILSVVTYKPYRLVSFGILWFFITLSLESSVIPIGHVIAEYRLYLASFGFVLLVTSIIYAGEMNQRRSNVIAVMVLIGFSIVTYQRNKVWGDELSLWNDTIAKSPYKARPYNGRGTSYANQGDFTHAIADFNQAIKLNPQYAEVYYNLGKIYYSQGNLLQSLRDYSMAIRFKPDASPAYNNRATVYYQLRQYDKAWGDVDQVEALGGVVNPAFISILKRESGRDK